MCDVCDQAAERVAASYSGTIDAAEVIKIVRAHRVESEAILEAEEAGVMPAAVIPIEMPNETGIPSAMLQTLVAFTGGPVVVVATAGDCITTQARGYHSQEQVVDLLKYALPGVENPNGTVTEDGILIAPMEERR